MIWCGYKNLFEMGLVYQNIDGHEYHWCLNLNFNHISSFIMIKAIKNFLLRTSCSLIILFGDQEHMPKLIVDSGEYTNFRDFIFVEQFAIFTKVLYKSFCINWIIIMYVILAVIMWIKSIHLTLKPFNFISDLIINENFFNDYTCWSC